MTRRNTGRLGGLLVMLLAVPATAQPVCSNPQSPRNLDPEACPTPYDKISRFSIVEPIGEDSILYWPRAGGAPSKLFRCGQHYHFPIETPQGCEGELSPPLEDEATPRPGQWVEVHTVYASKVRRDNCDPETLACCETGPFLVRAFAAKVTAEGMNEPILPPSGRPLAEWSGSTTGRESQPGECKPAAQWSFRLSCEFTLSREQLHRFKHADPARPVQTGDRLSKDLTLVLPP